MVEVTPTSAEGKKYGKKEIQQVAGIAKRLGSSSLKIVPGDSWTPHYRDIQGRQQALQDLLKGTTSPDRVFPEMIRPDGFTYRLEDIEEMGVDGVVGRIRSMKDYYESFDYDGYLKFLYGLKDRDVDLETATEMFNSFAHTKVQDEMLKRYGDLGKRQLKEALKDEGRRLVHGGKDRARTQKILDALKLKWLKEKGLLSDDLDEAFQKDLDGQLREIAESLEESYLDYVDGKGDGKERLVEKVRDNVQKIKQQQEEDKLDDFIEDALNDPDKLPPDLQNELDNLFNDFQPPENDIPPDFQNKFSPSMDPLKEGDEKEKVVPLCTISPPLTGLYQGPVYTRFNANTVEWELDPTLRAVDVKKLKKASKKGKHTEAGKIRPGGLLPIFLPRYNTINQSTLTAGLEVLKDENGTFYLRNNSADVAGYELNFSKEDAHTQIPPGAAETADIGSAALSQATKNYLAGLNGSNVQKAQAIVHYMKNILKLEYSNDPKYNRIYKQVPARYFAEIEKHKQVDCDVAQTYFIALCRAAGVPSRFIFGHSTNLVENGKAILHRGTGHAWTEVWDEVDKKWKTIDSTPEKTENDPKPPENGGQQGPSEETDIEAPEQEPRGEDQPPSPGEVEKKVNDKVEKTKQEGEGEPGEGGDGGVKADEISDKMREKMKELKERRESAKKEQKKGEKGDGEGGQGESGEGGGEGQGEPGESGEGSGEGQGEPGEGGGGEGGEGGGGEGQGEPGEGGGGEGGEGGGGQPESLDDDKWRDAQKKMEEMMEKDQAMEKKAQEVKDAIQEAKKVKDLKEAQKKLESEDLYDQDKKDLEDLLEAQEKKKQQELKDRIRDMEKDGFLDEDKAKEMMDKINKDDTSLDDLAKVEEQLGRESTLYEEYAAIRTEVMPLVKKYLAYFMKRLPKIDEADFDEDMLSRSGLTAQAYEIQPINLIVGKTQHPINESLSTQPKFIASLVLDISGSMKDRMRDARKLLIFWSELFSEISKQFGYIRFSISVFDTKTEVVKDFGHQYDSRQRYKFDDASKTVKLRLMEMTMARGGTDMGGAVWQANHSLNAELRRLQDRYMSSVQVFSDGDTGGQLQGEHLRAFIAGQQAAFGEYWGKHLKSAYFLGPESQKAILAQYFGDENSEAVPDMDELIGRSMKRFDRDSRFFCKKYGLITGN